MSKNAKPSLLTLEALGEEAENELEGEQEGADVVDAVVKHVLRPRLVDLRSPHTLLSSSSAGAVNDGVVSDVLKLAAVGDDLAVGHHVHVHEDRHVKSIVEVVGKGV